MKVLLVDNYDSFTFNLAQLLQSTELCEVKVVKNDNNCIDCTEFDKILFSPGPGIPRQEEGLMKYILQNYQENKSILGICLGHQAIAEYFGAELINLDNVFHGIKEKIKITDNADYIFSGIPGVFEAGLYHSWCISEENFPDCLKISAVSEKGIVMAFSHTSHDIKGFQFHPESIMTEAGQKIITNWLRK